MSKRKQYSHEWYLKNRDTILKRTSSYYHNNKEKCSASRKKWREKNLDSLRQKKREWYLKNREKILQRMKLNRVKYEQRIKAYDIKRCSTLKKKARAAVYYAVKTGRLVRSPSCNKCGVPVKKAEGHHHKGYEKEFWLDVQWLCSLCHGGYGKC